MYQRRDLGTKNMCDAAAALRGIEDRVTSLPWLWKDIRIKRLYDHWFHKSAKHLKIMTS